MLAQGLDVAAEARLTQSIQLSADIGDHVNVTFALDLLAFLESRRGNWHRALLSLEPPRDYARPTPTSTCATTTSQTLTSGA